MQRWEEIVGTLTTLLICAVCAGAGAPAGGEQKGNPKAEDGLIAFANQSCRYVIGADGTNRALVDLATDQDYCQRTPAAPVARAKIADRWHDAASAAGEGDRVTVAFAGTSATATLGVTMHPRYFVVEVLAAGGEVEELQFVNLPLTLQGSLDEPFAACALALNLQTDVPGIPGPSRRLQARCVERFGLAGAAVAVVACPTGAMRNVLKEVVSAAGSMPQSPLGGPWAMDAPINRASYLFANPTEQNVDEIIRTVKSVGFNQVQIHGGRGTYRFGDCLPNPKLYPRGMASIKAVIDRLHEAGIYAGMHPYAFFIDKAAPWVTPVPDPGLASDATFILAADLPADGATVSVRESTEAMSIVTGFFVRNSVTLRIDDELITYSGVSKEPPYGFTQCTRGALGTTAAAHAAGAKVHHLKECFGLFVPDPDSPLFTKVVEANADFFNACGFDTIYLDALDGEDTLGGRENSWHYGSKFVWELWRRLARPAAMEYSTFHHHLWVLRSRHGAWDHPTRAHQQFIDQHVAANRRNDLMFLPSNLGWWAFKTWQPPQAEPTFPEDIEYWCAKALGTNSGLSLQGYNPTLPGHQRLAAIVKQYEELRHAGYFSEAVKARLREPGAQFTLEQGADGDWQFRPVHTVRHKVRDGAGWSGQWTAHNPHPPQSPALRIEALMSAGPYDADDNVTLADFADAAEFSERASAPAVTAKLESVAEGDAVIGRLTAANAGKQRRGSWASMKKTFDPPLDLSKHQGLGVWVRGDGKGQVLNFQLQSPSHITRARAERYVVVDFEGWRYFELIELDADRYPDYGWPYYGGYHVYREQVQHRAVESLTIWCNHLPPEDTVVVDLRPVRALRLLPTRLVDPRLAIGSASVEFPVEIDSGSYLEVDPAGSGRLYGPSGEPLAEVRTAGPLPQLEHGANRFEFTCLGPPEPARRARVSIVSRGDPYVRDEANRDARTRRISH